MSPKRNSSLFSKSILTIMSSKSINLLANESGGLYQVPSRNGLECGFVISIIRHSRLISELKVVLRPKKNFVFPLDFKTMLTKH